MGSHLLIFARALECNDSNSQRSCWPCQQRRPSSDAAGEAALRPPLANPDQRPGAPLHPPTVAVSLHPLTVALSLHPPAGVFFCLFSVGVVCLLFCFLFLQPTS